VTLLRIDSSILGPNSASRALADIVQKHWVEEHGDTAVVTRDLGANPIPASYWPAAVSAGHTPQDQWSDEQKAATTLAAELFDELKNAETVIIATGLYNWGVNQFLKSWLDLIFTVAPMGEEVLKGKDVALIVTRGGYYGEDGPKAGWDHGTPWLERILSETWGANVNLIERDFTLVGVNPALDEFTQRGAQLRDAATAKSRLIGKEFAAAYAARKSA
jgi:FMN-dependent NADH-azoreductase